MLLLLLTLFPDFPQGPAGAEAECAVANLVRPSITLAASLLAQQHNAAQSHHSHAAPGWTPGDIKRCTAPPQVCCLVARHHSSANGACHVSAIAHMAAVRCSLKPGAPCASALPSSFYDSLPAPPRRAFPSLSFFAQAPVDLYIWWGCVPLTPHLPDARCAFSPFPPSFFCGSLSRTFQA